MPNRVIRSHTLGGIRQLADSLTSLLALELLAPGGRLYLISPRLGEMTAITSILGQFRALMPELGQSEMRLGEVLNLLASRSTTVRVLYRPGDDQTNTFINSLSSKVERKEVHRLDERSLIGERFYLRGSLEFKLGGIDSQEESVEITTDEEEVARALLDAEQLWGRY